MGKSIVVLVIDHDTYSQDHPEAEEFSQEQLVRIGRATNEDAASWFGYESWMIIHDIPESLFKELGHRNIPANPEGT